MAVHCRSQVGFVFDVYDHDNDYHKPIASPLIVPFVIFWIRGREIWRLYTDMPAARMPMYHIERHLLGIACVCSGCRAGVQAKNPSFQDYVFSLECRLIHFVIVVVVIINYN